MSNVAIDYYILNDDGSRELSKTKVILDLDDFNYFNSYSFFSGIRCAQHIFKNSKSCGYPFMPGPTCKDYDDERFAMKLHLHVAYRAGFAPENLSGVYHIHHINHNRNDARKQNLVGIPDWLNMSMTIKNAHYTGVKKTASGRYRASLCTYSFETNRANKLLDDEFEAAVHWLLIKNDYLRILDREFVSLYSCQSRCFFRIHSLRYMYIDDAPTEYRDDRLRAFNEAMRRFLVDDPKRPSIKKQEDGSITYFDGSITNFLKHSPLKRIRLDLDSGDEIETPSPTDTDQLVIPGVPDDTKTNESLTHDLFSLSTDD
jgi:hypothetical protein